LNSKLSHKLIIYALKQYSPLTLKQIAEHLGGLHYSSITKITKRLEEQALNDKSINKLLLKIDSLYKMSNVKT